MEKYKVSIGKGAHFFMLNIKITIKLLSLSKPGFIRTL